MQTTPASPSQRQPAPAKKSNEIVILGTISKTILTARFFPKKDWLMAAPEPAPVTYLLSE